MLNSKLRVVVMLITVVFVGVCSQSAFAMERVSDVELSNQSGAAKYYIGPCSRLGYYNCVPADGVTCHVPNYNGDDTANPDSYIDTPHSYRGCATNTPTDSSGCNRLEGDYTTVERQYYQQMIWGYVQLLMEPQLLSATIPAVYGHKILVD